MTDYSVVQNNKDGGLLSTASFRRPPDPVCGRLAMCLMGKGGNALVTTGQYLDNQNLSGEEAETGSLQ